MKLIIKLIIICIIIKAVALVIPIDFLDHSSPRNSFWINDRNGAVLREFNSREGYSASWTALATIPETYKKMLVLSEDKRFYWHPGIDPIATIRAAYEDITARAIVSGGSTITQQLARMILSDKYDRSFSRKVKEIGLAFLLELKYSKNQILEAYINRVYFGYQNRGIKAASEFYFGKTPESLSIAEQTYLITLAKSPGGYNPFVYPERMLKRTRKILRSSYGAKIINSNEYSLAINAYPVMQKNKAAFNAPHFINYLLAKKDMPGKTQINTTLDLSIQNQTATIIRTELGKLKKYNVNNAACLVVDVHTGEVLAYVGSQDFFAKRTQGEVDGVQALRQPGSALKPLIYAYALEHGLTPASILPDLPTTYYSNGGYFIPKNYSETYLGPVSLRTALANSLNAPALYTMSKLGSLSDILNTLRKLGLKSLNKTADHYGLGLILGNGEVSLWELAQSYLVLASGGAVKPLIYYTEKSNHRISEETRIYDPTTAYMITSILSDPLARQLSFGINSVLEQPFPCAVKTGTSTNYRDNWCIGYTPDYLVAVWVGNFDGSPMYSVSGVTGAGPIWHRVMQYVAANRINSFKVPSGIESRRICTETGLIADEKCEHTTQELFSYSMLKKLKVCSPEIHNNHAAKETSFLPIQPNELEKLKLIITYPRDNSTFAIDPRVDLTRQTIKLDYIAYRSPSVVKWAIDGQKIKGDSWQLSKGSHTIKIEALIDNNQIENVARITVY